MLDSNRVGYAVVGLGRFAQRRVLPAFRNSEKAKLVALVSGDAEKASRLAAQFGANSYNYEQFELCLADPAVQAVYITTVNGTHSEFALLAAALRKHVLCEKPMANTVE